MTDSTGKKRKKREEIDYAVEKVVDTIKVLEALQGDKYEAVSVDRIIERVGVIPGRQDKLKPDAVKRILITLKILNWAAQTEDGKWMLGKGILRLSDQFAQHALSIVDSKL